MDATVVIDFESSESHLLLNPRLPDAERSRLEAMVPGLEGHVYVTTSGSTGETKLVALSKKAILASAEAVNERLGVSSGDVWCSVLPEFHVGGLGIVARAHLAGAAVVRLPSRITDEVVLAIERERVTLLSLVPAQLFDLVKTGRRPPASLRHVLIGGGRLEEALGRAAREIGWPVRASYGATECASTIAVARSDGELELLRHVEASERDGRLAFRSPALLTGYCRPGGVIVDPKVGGWFCSEDRGGVDGRLIRVEGRDSDFVKIGGEPVDLSRLDRIAAETGGLELAVVAVPDARLGSVIHLVLSERGNPDSVVQFNERVLPFERGRGLHRVTAIPRSPLGKLLRGRLLAEIRGESEARTAGDASSLE